MMMLAIGVAIVPLGVQLFDARWAPAALGVLLVLLAAALGTRVVFIDRHAPCSRHRDGGPPVDSIVWRPSGSCPRDRRPGSPAGRDPGR